MRAAVLIVGSLFWDDNPARRHWRAQRLQTARSQLVRAPIRYGRRSGSRRNTYTMTISTDVELGTARLVPCVAAVDGVDDLLVEAQALWAAEQPNGPEQALGAKWGCCGVMFQEHLRDLRESWKQTYRQTVKHSIPPVSGSGELCIAWPISADGGSVAADVVLATATKAEEQYPSPTEIADAWIAQAKGEEKYFFENVRCGIRTCHDVDIWRRIEACAPTWLTNGAYVEAVETLRSECNCGV